ncbi:DUF11 domain-containing protein [Candidatus Uhrbacteria bacterium]|nr:DUF11 domain-containing protein [Candidatus Uhrbacteria bacterium]
MMVRRKRHSSREIKQELRSIYTRDGHIPNLTKLDRAGRSGFTRLLIKLILLFGFLSAIAWGGFFLFSQGFFHDNETLVLTVEGPDEVKSGEPSSFTFIYENTGSVPIASLKMKLNVPDSFHVLSSVPEPDESGEWTIGSVSAGSDGKITVSGVFLSEVPSSQRLQALYTYKPANFNSDFQDIATHKVEIVDSVVALSLTGPEKALAGDTSEYVVNVQNTGSEPVYNLRVTPNLPQDFSLSQSDPALGENETSWNILTLAPGELKAITLKGSFTSTASGEQKVSVSVGFVDDELTLPQATQEVVTDVLGGSVAFSVIVNGSNENQNAQVGDSLRISIDYENASEETVEDLSFDMNLTGQNGAVPIDWSRADLGDGSRSGNTISWDQSAISSLKKLDPDDSSVIDLLLPVSSELNLGDADAFTITVTLTLGKVGNVTSTRILDATPITVSLNSDVRVNAQARYYSESGSAIGSGPLPPKVGETTSYRVYLNVTNSLHTLSGVKMSTTIPQDVTWLDNTDTDIGTVSYNATTRLVTWSISKMPVTVGHAGAWFDVLIHPDAGDVGRFVKLANTTSFEAKDTVTNESLSESLSELTSELPEDDFAKGEGVVVDN